MTAKREPILKREVYDVQYMLETEPAAFVDWILLHTWILLLYYTRTCMCNIQ
jgi:hypothetical protein